MPEFIGFSEPVENWSKLPHTLIESLKLVTSLAELKVILYILRHTWGYQEFETHKRITTEEFSHGRKRSDGTRIDDGTGMSEPAIRDGLNRAVEHGFITVQVDDSDLGRIQKFYQLNMLYQRERSLPPDSKEFTPWTKDSLPRTEKDTGREKPIKENTAKQSRVIFEAIAQHVYGIANLKGLSRSSAGRIGKLEKIARQLITSRDPAATDELIARRVASFASAETFKPAIQGATGFELKFAAYLEVTHTLNKPRPESEPEDDEHLITPEQVAFARQLFNETVSRHNANSRPRQ